VGARVGSAFGTAASACVSTRPRARGPEPSLRPLDPVPHARVGRFSGVSGAGAGGGFALEERRKTVRGKERWKAPRTADAARAGHALCTFSLDSAQHTLHDCDSVFRFGVGTQASLAHNRFCFGPLPRVLPRARSRARSTIPATTPALRHAQLPWFVAFAGGEFFSCVRAWIDWGVPLSTAKGEMFRLSDL